MIEWILIAAIAVSGALVIFWDKIRDWLMTTVADWLERKFGPKVRQAAVKAIVAVDRVIINGKRVVRKVANLIFNKEALGTKSNFNVMRVVEYDSESNYTLEELQEMDKRGKLVQEFVTKGGL